jgi:hypothetical protein
VIETTAMLRSAPANAAQYALAFLVGVPIFASFKLARAVLRRDDSLSRITATGGDPRV